MSARLTIDDAEDALSLNEVARALHVCSRTVTRYREDGKLNGIRLSARKFIYLRRDVEKLLNRSYIDYECDQHGQLSFHERQTV